MTPNLGLTIEGTTQAVYRFFNMKGGVHCPTRRAMPNS